MPYDFEIKILSAQPAMARRARVTRAEIGQTLGQIFPAVYGELQAQGAAPVGAPYARYLTMSDAGFDLEGGMPVDKALAASGETYATELPGGTFGFTVHAGPYEQLPAAHEALGAWLHGQGWELAGAPWESYVTDPGADPDPSTWKTEIFMPVKRP